MKFGILSELIGPRDLRNGVLGIVTVVGGLLLAGLTYYAHRTDQPRVAGIAAAVSLGFVLLILIFVVPPLARNASREASQMNLPFEFTMGGAIMLGLIMIVGFSAWNTGNNLLFLVLSFLAASMFVGFAAGTYSLRKLDVKMRFPETIFAGEDTPILVSMHNRKRFLPSISIVTEVRGNEREESVAAPEIRDLLPSFIAERFSKAPIIRRTLDYFVYVPRNSVAESRALHRFPHRGRFLIRDFEISTKFPFSFFRHRRRLPARETELTVFPSLERTSEELGHLSLESGNRAAGKRGSGQDLLAMRDYQPNDDLRRVDWKATARSRHLIIREFSAEDDKRVSIVLDTQMPMDARPRITVREKVEAERQSKETYRSERFESAVTKAASLAAHFTEEQAEVRLIIDSEVGEFGIGARHLYELLKRLATIEPSYSSDPQNIFALDELDSEQNSHRIVITPAAPNALESDRDPDIIVVNY